MRTPEGFTVERTRVTWCQPHDRLGRQRITHPTVYIVTDPEGTQRTFDTRADADVFIVDYLAQLCRECRGHDLWSNYFTPDGDGSDGTQPGDEWRTLCATCGTFQ